MVDYTLCQNDKCIKKEICLRYLKFEKFKPNDFYQSYSLFNECKEPNFIQIIQKRKDCQNVKTI